MNKGIIYTRKSTNDKEKQQQSLGTQLDWCENYASINNIEIFDTIIVSESAKDTGREGFEKLMNQIEKGHANIIICMYFDRLSRNPRDSAWIQELLQKGKILKIITSTRIFTIEDSGLLFSVESGFANEYILKIKKGVKDGFKEKMKKGGYYSQAPLGYINETFIEKSGSVSKIISIDPERAHFIPRMFQMRADGCSVEMIRDVLYEEGLRTKSKKFGGGKVSKATLEEVLKNTFYYGTITYKGKMLDTGYQYIGSHTPLISKELFEKAQITRGISYKKSEKVSALKGIVKFGSEKKLMNASKIKDGKHIFFNTRLDGKQIWIPEKTILSYFDENIDLYRIPLEYKKDIEEALWDTFREKSSGYEEEIRVLNRKISEKEQEKKNITFMRSRGEISGEDFVKYNNEISSEIQNFVCLVSKKRQESEEILVHFNELVELLFFGLDKWKNLGDYQKGEFIREVVVELIFDEQKRLYIAENQLYEAIKSQNLVSWSLLPSVGGTFIKDLYKAIFDNEKCILQSIKLLKNMNIS